MAVILSAPYSQFFDDNGDPLNGGKVYTYAAGTTTPKATFTDAGGGTQAANPIELDSAGRAAIWVNGAYKFTVTDALGTPIRTVDNVTVSGSSSSVPFAIAGGTVDAITADFSPDLSLTDGLLVEVRALGANTSTTPTFAPDGTTARTIVKKGGQALSAGDIPAANAVILLQYDLANTRWELLNPSAAGDTFASRLLHVREEQTSGTNPQGSVSAAVWNVRILNTVLTNEIPGASLATNQITLPAGTYMIMGHAPSSGLAQGHKARFYNATDASATIIGTTEKNASTASSTEVSNRSTVTGRFTIANSKTFELQHWVNNVAAGATGLAISVPSTVEVYSEVLIWKVA